jgi:hypothetical protein
MMGTGARETGYQAFLVCNNGADDDRDGRIDAADPGCSSALDGSET